MFILVGLGLGDASDITLKGLKAVHEADVVYLEAYTSFLINSSAEELANVYERPVLVADREMVESGEVLQEASDKKVVLLVVGDVFGALHTSTWWCDAMSRVFLAAPSTTLSIINAVGCCGLQLYRFGQVISLCFWTETWHPDSWYDRLMSNREMGLHTLVLLDIKVKEISDENLARGRNVYEPPRYMRINEAIEQILEVEQKKKGGAVAEDGSTMSIALARVGSNTQQVVAGAMRELRELDFGDPLHSLIIAGDIHTCETEHVNLFRLK
ncbi:putative diphthine synthase [Trypanosoma cruzi]|nr:putative diphthine synthase [Trypanosoma cruzi]